MGVTAMMLSSRMTIDKAEGWRDVLTSLAYLLAPWAAWPHPYVLFVLVVAATPILAMTALLSSSGRIQICCGSTRNRPDVSIAILLPGLMLILRAVLDYPFIFSRPAVIIGAAVSLSVMCGYWLLARLLPDWLAPEWAASRDFFVNKLIAVIIMLFVVFCYSFSVAIFANVLGDNSVVATYRVPVVGKYTTSSKGVSYTLDLAPWAFESNGGSSVVPQTFYDAVQTGQDVCFDLHRGRLGWHWARLRLCQS